MRPYASTIAVALLAGSAAADTFTVHPMEGVGDFLTPGAALASPLVTDGDRIEVHPGTYAGTLYVGKAVELVSTAGPELTVLDGAGSGPVLSIAAGATVRGFTITGAGGFVTYGGVEITSTTTVLLEGNVIAENHPVGDVGIPAGGVVVTFGASAVLRGNDIHSNTSLSVGGVLAGPMSTVDMIDNVIRGNGGGTITGGVLFGASGRIVNTQITGNHGSGIGGLYIAGGLGPDPWGATVDVVNCTIYGNLGASPMGSVGGVFLDDGGKVKVRNTLILSNFGTPGGDLMLSSDFAAPPTLGTIDIDYSHVLTVGSGIVPGAHMVPAPFDPLLAAPAMATMFGPTLAGDFRPTKHSPEVDAGLDEAFPADLPERDLDGDLRIFGPAIDVGAFEHVVLRPFPAPRGAPRPATFVVP